MYKFGVINDLHLPYQDPRAVELALYVMEDARIDELIINGDVLDFNNISRHGKSHIDLQTSFEDEIHEGKIFFNVVKKHFTNKGVKTVYNRGNHEEWLDNFIINKCPEFYNFCKLDKMIDFGDIIVNPYNYAYQIKPNIKLKVQHSPPAYGLNGCRSSMNLKGDTSYIWGCSHQMQTACRTNDSGELVQAWFNGWLGSQDETPDHKLVFKYKKSHMTWQQCIIIGHIVGDNFYIDQIPLKRAGKKLQCMYNGNIYEV